MEETMRTITCLAVTAAFLVVPFPASDARADVYRCVLDGGHVSYQQIPCHYGSKPMALKDRRSGWSSLRPGEQALLNSYRKKDAARRRKPPGAHQKSVKETRSCWNKRKQLEAIRSKLRRGYKLKEGNELRRKRDNYDDYLRQFCS
ncbi:MAG TPA: DUF4124 domain-containing protein [Gammaproteobacteria bacterium]|nr:DUF4124 domain-containing protein [Gammaproteobacteria bacterium]